jgi:Uma2 family endonuclease
MATAEVDTGIYLCLEMAGTLMTPEEFDAVEDYDDEYRYELVNGVLVVTPLPLAAESGPNEELGYLLRRYQEDHPQGKIINASLAEQYIYLPQSRRRADRVIWTGLGRFPNRKRDQPSIVIEFPSRRRRDRQRDYNEKQREYMKLGIAEYWIIDRFKCTLTVWRNSPGGTPQKLVIQESETYQPPLLPGFELPLARLLAIADRWAKSEE